MDELGLEDGAILQIGFITNDLEKSAKSFSKLTGRPVPAIMDATGANTHIATIRGIPTRVECRIAMFDLGSIIVEFVEPGPGENAWRDMLDRKGSGVHHLAFKTRNMTGRIAALAEQGHSLVQQGEFLDGGGRYAYIDTSMDFGAMIELIEFDADRTLQE